MSAPLGRKTNVGAASAPSWEDVTVEPCRKRVTPDSRPARVRRPTESPDAGVASARGAGDVASDGMSAGGA